MEIHIFQSLILTMIIKQHTAKLLLNLQQMDNLQK